MTNDIIMTNDTIGSARIVVNHPCGIAVPTTLNIGDTVTSGWGLAVLKLRGDGLYVIFQGTARLFLSSNGATQSCTLGANGIAFDNGTRQNLTNVTALLVLDNGTVYELESNGALVGPDNRMELIKKHVILAVSLHGYFRTRDANAVLSKYEAFQQRVAEALHVHWDPPRQS